MIEPRYRAMVGLMLVLGAVFAAPPARAERLIVSVSNSPRYGDIQLFRRRTRAVRLG